MGWAIYLLDLFGVAVFAASGALVASRKEMDLIGFGLLATLTGIGGGSLRDVLLSRPVFWLSDPTYPIVCLAVAAALYFLAAFVERRYTLLLWLDALGLAAFAVLGAHIAVTSGTDPLPAVVLGMITATFGGTLRDVLTHETPLILKPEIYATAAVAAAMTYVLLRLGGVPVAIAAYLGVLSGFALRAGAMHYGWSLPRYRPRPGRKF